MTKIREEDNFDDLNFDDLGDWDDFGSFEDGEPTVGKRSVFGRLLGGFKDGVKASFIDPKNHRTVVKEALPKGYSRIYDAGEFTLESTSDLLREAQKGYGQNRDQMKKAMRDILPSFGETTNTSRVGKTLKEWSEDIRSPQSAVEDVDPEKAFLATEMNDAFGQPNEAAIGGNSSEDKAKKIGKVTENAQRKMMEHASRTSQILADRVGMAQMNAMVQHLAGSHMELQKLTAYQDQVTSQYQRKSLEIKYRHYFVARKSLDVLMQTLDLNKSAYDKIITNTSLPEAVKIQTSEHAQMILREKFLGTAIEPARAKLGQIGSRILQKSKAKIQEFFKDLGAGLANINDAASTVLGPDSGIDPWELGGDIVGQQAGAWGMKKLAGKAAGFLGKNKKLARLGQAGASALDNGGRIFQSMLRNDTGIAAFEWLKGTGFLDEFAYRRDETVRKDASSLLDEQALWDQKSRKALTEVIPGLLEISNHTSGSILAFLKGEPEPPMKRYNYASGLFESEKDIRSRIKKDVFGDASNKDTAQALRNFVGEFEQKRKLSKEAKSALMNTALQESLNGGVLNMEAYSRGDKRWSTDDKINDEIQKAFMETFYSDYQAGVDDNTDGSFMGDLNRTFRRGESISQRTKAMAHFQSIADHQGVLNKESMLKHMNVAGGNTLLDLGVVKQEGNTLVINREKIDANIIRQALTLDVGYLTSTVFDLEESENSLGHSVNSHVKKLITDLDKRYAKEIDAADVLKIRTAYSIIRDHVFAGSNQRLLDVTDLETSEKKKLLDAFSKKLFEWMGGADFNTMGEPAQEYFQHRFDLIKTGMNAARITAPLRDFVHDPLQIDEGAWGKSKKKVLDGLRDAGLDEEILKQLESSIKDVKDATGRTVDMKLAELTGTKTYSEAARFLNRMTDKGLNWITKSLNDPNTPPDPVLDPGGMFTKLSQTADHLSKHSAVGRWMYSQLLKMDSTVNNSYENIKNNQNLKNDIDRYANNADGSQGWYEGSKRNPYYNLITPTNPLNPLDQAGFGVWNRTPRKPKEEEEERTEEQTSIIQSAADVVVDIFRNFADRMNQFGNSGSTAPRMSWSNQGPLFNPANMNRPSGLGEITGINADIEIHHTGGIVGRGRRWGGAASLFSNAQRYHTGGVVQGELQLTHDNSQLGLMHATLPNGEQITVFDHRLAKKGFNATAKDFESALKRGRERIYSKYSRHFEKSSARSRAALKPDEVPAVLQRGEEVLTADDPRHSENINSLLNGAKGFTFNSISKLTGGIISPEMLRRGFDSLTTSTEPKPETKPEVKPLAEEANRSPIQPVESGVKQDTTSKVEVELGTSDQILSGILENTSITNELLQELLLKEFAGGGGSGFFRRQLNKIKNGWNKGKSRVGKMVTNIRSRISSLSGGGPGLFSKAKDWVKDKLTGVPERLGKAKDWIKGKGQAAWTKANGGVDWAKRKGGELVESAQELGQRLKAKIPTLDEIKKFGGVMVDKTWVPAKQFITEKYQASAEWWKAHYPNFTLDFSEFWTGFKEKFKNWKPVSWVGDKLNSARSYAGMTWNTAKELGGNLLNGPRKLKNWVGGKVRSGLNMLKGFMSGGMWAAMKYREVESITDEVSGLRQVYLSVVDLQSIIMDRLPKPRSKWNDKDGDGKRDASARFIGRAEEPKTDKDGNVVPGEEKKTEGLFGSIFGKSLMGFAIKALIGGIVGETMSNLFGFDLGLLGNTAAGMAAVGGGIWAAKKAAGWAAGKAGDLAKGALGRATGRGASGRGGRGAAGGIADALGGQGCGCCCCDDGMDGLGDTGSDERRKKRGKKGKKGRSRGGRNQNRSTRTTRTPRSGGGTHVPAGAGGAAAGAAESTAARAAAAGGRGAAARSLLGSAGEVAGRIAAPLAVAAGGYQLYQTINDEEMSTDEKVQSGSEIVGGTGGALAGAAAGAAIGSIVPGVGTLIGGAIGGMAGYWMGSKAGGVAGEAINGVRNNSLWDLAKGAGAAMLATSPLFAPMKLAAGLWGGFDSDKSPITTFRFAQYGFDVNNDKYGQALMGLEADLLKEVKAVDGRTPTINPKRPVEEYFEMFKVDPTNETEKMEWLQWFHYRFKPVFLSHVSEWHRILKNTKLHDGDDKLGCKGAAEYLKNVHYKNADRSPCKLLNNPFGDEKGKLLDPTDVAKAYTVAVKAAEKLPDRPLGDPEKKALGITEDKNKAQEAKENLDAKKAEEKEEKSAKLADEGGLWSGVKNTLGNAWDATKNALSAIPGIGLGVSAMSKVAGFFTDKDSNQMSGWDRATNAVTTFGQEAAGTVGSFIGGTKAYASHELTLAKACIAAGITHPKEVAMFIAQCAHETGGFKWLKELGNDSYFRKYDGRRDLGNGPNDGAKFKGRGYIQLTGRANYTRFAKATGIDVVNNPDQVSNDKGVAAKAAVFWWLNSKRARAAGQAGDVVAASKAVNGGTNGLQDRIAKWNYYSKAIGNDLNAWVAKLESGQGGVIDKASKAISGTADSAKSMLSNAAHTVGAAAVGARASVSGAVASTAASANGMMNKGRNIVTGAMGNVGIGTGEAPSAVPLGGKGATPWMTLAEKQLGVNEKDHPALIREYHKLGGKLNAGGETPWCASFIGWVLEKCGLKGSGSAAAISYAKYGQPLDKGKPIPYGAIMVIKFGKGNHVAFCAADKGSKVTMLGGNQSSKKGGDQRNGGEVTLSTIPKANVYAVVYPSGYTAGPAKTTADNISNTASGVGSESQPASAAPLATGTNAAAVGAAAAPKSKATYSETDRLAKLQSMKAAEEGNVSASKTPAPDNAAQSGLANKTAVGKEGTTLQKVAGTETATPVNGKVLTQASGTSKVAQDAKADLTAVKEAENAAVRKDVKRAEAEKVEAAMQAAKTTRVNQLAKDSEEEKLNIMRESLSVTKQMRDTLKEMSRSLQTIANNSGQNLRGGESKPTPTPPRKPSPPEAVPVSMRI